MAERTGLEPVTLSGAPVSGRAPRPFGPSPSGARAMPTGLLSEPGGPCRSRTCGAEARRLQRRGALYASNDPWVVPRARPAPVSASLRGRIRTGIGLSPQVLIPPDVCSSGAGATSRSPDSVCQFPPPVAGPRARTWWARGDSNPHGRSHRLLRPACLPRFQPLARTLVEPPGVEPGCFRGSPSSCCVCHVPPRLDGGPRGSRTRLCASRRVRS